MVTSCLQCKIPKFSCQAGKIPWRREWQPTPVFSPREFHGQRSLAVYSRKALRHDWANQHFHSHFLLKTPVVDTEMSCRQWVKIHCAVRLPIGFHTCISLGKRFLILLDVCSSTGFSHETLTKSLVFLKSASTHAFISRFYLLAGFHLLSNSRPV